MGSSSAPITLVEFSDFQCPFCARFVRDTLPYIRSAYITPGRVQLIFKNLPLEGLHPRARAAAEAAACASAQGHFWEMHDKLFAVPNQVNDEALLSAASSIGLRVTAFKHCVAHDAAVAIAADVTLSRTLRLTGTPSFLVGRTSGHSVIVDSFIDGARDTTAFKAAIDKSVGMLGTAVTPQ
jgi:protein-disulfide isomerase